MRAINYTLDQTNHVQRTSRTQDENWTEWTPTFAVRVRSRDLVVSYSMSYTCGPSCFSSRLDTFAPPPTADVPVIAAPGAPITFDGGTSSQHRVMVSIRLR